MTLAELVYRTYRTALLPLEELRTRNGYNARLPSELAQWMGPAAFYFEGVPSSLSTALRDRADAICRGEHDVLGLGRLSLPEYAWKFDPITRAPLPRMPATRVSLAVPPHFDARLAWELGRGHEWVVLACAHAITGERQYHERLKSDFTAWCNHNPVGLGIHWVSAMEVAIRIHSMAWCAAFLRHAEKSELMVPLASAIYEHVLFVSRHPSRFSSANNHLIVELTGLCVGARTLGNVGALERLHARSLDALERECARQVLADGVSGEMATHYHQFVHDAVELVARLERVHGRPRVKLERVVDQMRRYIDSLRCEDGSLLQQGDSDDGEIVPDAVLELATPRSLEQGSTVSHHFDVSNQVVFHSPRLHVAIDCGQFGFGTLAAHAHCDALALAAAIDGQRTIVDRGTYRYNGAPEARNWFRSTAAHNTLQLGAREQADSAGPFLWSRRPRVDLERCKLGASGDVVVASHDGFAPWRHRRTLLRAGDLLGIIDEVEGPPTSEAATVRWHLAPGRTSARRDSAWDIHGAANAWLWCSTAGTALATPHSDRYGEQRLATTLEFRATSRIVTVLGPQGVAPTGELSRLASAHGLAISLPEGW